MMCLFVCVVVVVVVVIVVIVVVVIVVVVVVIVVVIIVLSGFGPEWKSYYDSTLPHEAKLPDPWNMKLNLLEKYD